MFCLIKLTWWLNQENKDYSWKVRIFKKRNHTIIHKKKVTDSQGKKGMVISRCSFHQDKSQVSMKAIAIKSMLDGPHETMLVLLDLTGKCLHYQKHYCSCSIEKSKIDLTQALLWHPRAEANCYLRKILLLRSILICITFTFFFF